VPGPTGWEYSCPSSAFDRQKREDYLLLGEEESHLPVPGQETPPKLCCPLSEGRMVDGHRQKHSNSDRARPYTTSRTAACQ